MKYFRSHTPLARALAASALLAALLMITLVPSSLPISFAGSEAKHASADVQPQSPGLTFGAIYSQTNLVSDLPGVALVEDRQLVNPWGVAVSPSSPFWVVDNKLDRATLYRGDVSGSPLAPDLMLPFVGIPNVPTFAPAPSQPTGVVANTTNDFLVALSPTSPAAPAQFIFATLSGGINAWHPGLGSTAIVVKFVGGHSYTGLTLGANAGGNLLYAADFAHGKIDVFDKDFNQTSVSGNFADATVPANFHPFNIQNLGGALYVSYAEFNHVADDFGFVRKFDMNGVRDVAFAINNGPLFSPWGMAMAPANFGPFSNQLVVGNFRSIGTLDYSISAFNPATGALLGHMVDGSGAALKIDKLRALVFGNGTNGGDPNTLYFSAGIYSENHGLFGSLKPVIGIPASTIRFSNTDYSTTEGAGHIDIAVTRTADVSGAATVNYATVDFEATQRSNYELAVGRLTFNPGETSKTFRVLIVDNNAYAGGSSTELDLVLSNATGAALVTAHISKLRILDDEGDTPRQPPNILDDQQYFVRQHYYDFLNREPDPAGLNFWTSQITSCGNDQQCIEIKRINVSAAFFLSIEFQTTGMLAYLTEKAAFGGLPRYGPFMRDVQALQKDFVFGAPGADAQLEANKRAFFDEFVTRPEFVAKYGGLTNEQFVLELLTTGGLATTTGRLLLTQLTGGKVVPSVSTPAIGLSVGQIGFDIVTVRFSMSLKDLSSQQIAAHIHGPAPATGNAPILHTLPNGEFTDFPVTIINEQNRDLRAGLLYIDVHTVNHPDGEIRGQIPQLRFIRDALTNALNDGIITRAQALRFVAEDIDFRQNELNRAFVLMEYFGYLRRNPDAAPDNNLSGYNFWLDKLNSFNGDYITSEMVKAFSKSSEYRSRFGPP
ncbi:MAG TPA: TIGR03118 family protein [Pyrinomonadaceae bacterium]|nr:TIGR03118 family protein [Pyrinomonadaceae bacterium]